MYQGMPLPTKEPIEFLTVQEARLLLQAITEPRDKAIVLLFLTTGIFMQELAELTLSSIDWKQKQLLITGKRPRQLPLPDLAYDALTAWSKERVNTTTDILFLTTKGALNGLSERSIDHLIRKYAGKANITKTINAQVLRQTYAVTLFKDGHSLEKASHLLGISDRESLKRYRDACTTPTTPTPNTSPKISPLDTRPFLTKKFAKWLPETPKEGITLDPQNDINISPTILFGRESLITKLRSSIYHNQPVVLIGSVGIGKTHILEHLASHYPNSLYVPNAKPTKQFLEQLCAKIDPNWEKDLGSRASVSELMAWILKTPTLSLPLLFIDDFNTIAPADSPLFLDLLDHGATLITASSKPLDKLHKLQWRLHAIAIDPLSEAASKKLLDYLTQGLSITDPVMLETRVMTLANGLPAAIVELARQLRYHPVVTQDVVRDIYHESGVQYRDWSAAIIVLWALIVCSRFIALGLHSFEGYILAGIGTSLFVVVKYFLMRMR